MHEKHERTAKESPWTAATRADRLWRLAAASGQRWRVRGSPAEPRLRLSRCPARAWRHTGAGPGQGRRGEGQGGRQQHGPVAGRGYRALRFARCPTPETFSVVARRLHGAARAGVLVRSLCRLALPGCRVTRGPGPPPRRKRCITSTADLACVPAKLRSESSTYGDNVVRSIIGAKRGAGRAKAPQVQRLRGRRGQRGPAARQLPAARAEGRAEDPCLPRHPLRRGARQQGPRGGRHAAGARRRGARAAGASGRAGSARQPGAGARVHRCCSRTSTCWPSTSRPAWRCTAARGVSLRRDRAAAARAARGAASSNSCTGSTRRPRACCCWPRSAAR